MRLHVTQSWHAAPAVQVGIFWDRVARPSRCRLIPSVTKHVQVELPFGDLAGIEKGAHRGLCHLSSFIGFGRARSSSKATPLFDRNVPKPRPRFSVRRAAQKRSAIPWFPLRINAAACKASAVFSTNRRFPSVFSRGGNQQNDRRSN
jgi:hypothetical protein